MLNSIKEHLLTRKKYNKLQNHCDILEEDLVKITNERDTLQKIRDIESKKFEEALDEKIEEIMKLKQKNKELRNKNK